MNSNKQNIDWNVVKSIFVFKEGFWGYFFECEDNLEHNDLHHYWSLP